uniref:Ycf55 n=1 Tax=Schizymenia dubyi TaxID=38368 RepID=A0A1C9C9F1_9FLOR|nr:hypothetical protein Schiz_119 [Schizymenia dubyi]AOM65002.1 hypothetical protein Schiz_119 [Schizymenia dubyi]
MVKYWPNQSGFDLNNQVANLFFNTKQKFLDDLSNKTSNNLYLDIIDNATRCKLFSIVLLELELLILDLVELDLNLHNLKLLNRKILYDLIQKSLSRFLYGLKFKDNRISLSKSRNKYCIKILSLEYELLLHSLLIYLVFGSSSVSRFLFAFDNIYTPKQHVSLLLENTLVQISNAVLFIIIDNIQSLSNIVTFLITNQLSDSLYMSLRYIAFFRNSLLYQSVLSFYINQPKEIYSSQYKVWLISSKGLVIKYIYASRLHNFLSLSSIKRTYIFLLEVQDLILPQLESIFTLFGKMLLYFFINVLGTSIVFIIRAIIYGFRVFYRSD